MPESAEPKLRTCSLAALSLFLAIVVSFLLLLFGVPILLCRIPGKAAYSLADLLLGLGFSLCEYVHPCLMLLIVPFLAICAVVFGHVARRRIRHSEVGLTGKKLALTGLIMGYVCLPLCLILSVVTYSVTYSLAAELGDSFFEHFEDFDESKQPWVECAIPLPDDLGRIVFMRRHVHPFLAEYDRKIRFETDSLKDMVQPLPMNAGGRTKINVYWYPVSNASGPFIRLEDHWGEYLVDLQRGVTRSTLRYKGALFAQDLVEGHGGSLYVMEDASGVRSVMLGNQKAEEVTGELARSPGQYLGRLDGTKSPLRFIPADDAPEERIEPAG